MNKIKTTAENTFYQLIVVYTFLVILISLNLFWKYTLHFEIFALILGILGITLIWKMDEVKVQSQSEINNKIHYSLIGLAIFLILLFRIIPYINNPIPLGYDAGIYKYGIETFSKYGFSSPNWVLGAFSPLFLYFMTLVSWFLSSQFILTYSQK